MKYLIFLFIMFFNYSYGQEYRDTTIYKDSLIYKKIFFSSKNQITVIYIYDDKGVLIKRYWYNKENELIGVCFDD